MFQPNLRAYNRRKYGLFPELRSCLFLGFLLFFSLRPSFLQYGTLELGGLQFFGKCKQHVVRDCLNIVFRFVVVRPGIVSGYLYFNRGVKP